MPILKASGSQYKQQHPDININVILLHHSFCDMLCAVSTKLAILLWSVFCKTRHACTDYQRQLAQITAECVLQFSNDIICHCVLNYIQPSSCCGQDLVFCFSGAKVQHPNSVLSFLRHRRSSPKGRIVVHAVHTVSVNLNFGPCRAEHQTMHVVLSSLGKHPHPQQP